MTLSQGYLERPYSVDGYVVGTGTENIGFQVLVGRNKLQAVPVQARMQFLTNKVYAAQAFLTIERKFSSGFQSDLTLDKRKSVGIQTLARIENPPNMYAFQANMLIGKTISSGFQSDSSLTKKSYTGFQTRVEIVRKSRSSFQTGITIDKTVAVPFQVAVTHTLRVNAGFQSLVTITSGNTRASLQAVLTIDAKVRGAFQALHTPVLINSYGAQASPMVTATARFFACSADITQIMHYDISSYLIGNYLAGSYLISGQVGFLPIQANVIQSQKMLSAFQSLITQGRGSKTAAQSLITISKTRSAPVQANIVQERIYSAAAQAFITPVKQNNSGAQSHVTISKTKYAPIQASVFSGISVAFQGRVVIYNTNKLRILTDFPSRGLTGESWTCNSVATGDFSPNNLNTDLVEQVFRTAPGGVTNIELICDTGLSQGVFVDTLAILNHNFSGSASVFFDGSNTSGFIAVETIPVVLDRTPNAYYIAPTMPSVSYRYWRLRITDVANADGFVQIGTIVFGSSVIFGGDNFVDQVRFGRKQFADSVFTEGFTNVKNARGLKKNFNLEFKNLNFDRADYKNLRTIIETQSTLFKCLWIPTPQSPARFALFGKMTELPQESVNYKGKDADYIDVSINVDEAE